MDKFQSRRSWWEILLLVALTGLSAFALVKLRDYQMIPSIPQDPSPIIDRKADSITAAHNYNTDSLSVLIRPLIDDELVDNFIDTVGVFETRKFIREHHIPHLLYEMSFVKSARTNFVIGTGTNSRQSSEARSNLLQRIFLSQYGEIVGSLYTDSAYSGGRDTAKILARLKENLPPEFHNKNLNWQYDTTAKSGITYYADLKKFPLYTERISVRAKPLSVESNTKWEYGWEKIFLANNAKEEEAEGGGNRILATILTIIVAIIVLGMAGFFIHQLRKRAISYVFFSIVTITITLYFFFTSAASIHSPPAIVIVLILLGCFIIFGFFLAGMPLSAIVSFAQEKFPQKFYSTRRLLSAPWTSHYVGKSLLWGFAIGLLQSVFFPLLFYVLHQSGKDASLRYIIFNSGWIWLSLSAASVFLAGVFFIPIMHIAGVIAPPAFAYRLERRWRFAVGLIGSAMFSGLVTSFTGDNDIIIMNGVLGGVIGFLLFWYRDVLALFVMSLVSAGITFLALSEAFPWVKIFFYATFGIVAILGVIAYFQTPEEVSEEDFTPDFLRKLGEEKRIREELSAAKIVQSRLLPTKMPSYPELDIAATCIPTYEVGGDYYDFFQLDDHRLGILIGDVSGKGMSAAFYITLAKGVIVSQVKMALSPADVLSRVNRLLYETMERGKFISLIYGIFDTQTMDFTYAQAGHNPIIMREGSTGNARMLEARGLALGLDSGKIFDQTVKNHVVHLYKDDTLIMYTDGVTEAVNAVGTELGDDLFLRIVEASGGSSAESLGDILSKLRNFIGKAKQRDDITLVVVKCAQAETKKMLA